MKRLLFLLLFLLNLPSGISQELQLSRKDRRYLDSLSRAMILKFGEDGYTKMLGDATRSISLGTVTEEDGWSASDRGRQYYEVAYSYDRENTRYVLEWDYVAKVRIWKDTRKIYDILFGNGYGYHAERMLEDEKRGQKIKRMGFYTIDQEEKRRESREFKEKMRAVYEEARLRYQRHVDSLVRIGEMRRDTVNGKIITGAVSVGAVSGIF